MVGRNEGRDYPLERESTRIGSAEGAEIRLVGYPSVLPWHAQVSQQQGNYSVSSASGQVVLNGQPIRTSPLQSGDLLGIGQATMVFVQKTKGGAAPTKTQVQSPYVSRTGPAAVPPIMPIQTVLGSQTLPSLERAGGLLKQLSLGTNLLGRDPASAINYMNDQAVSRSHAEILVGGVSAIVRDAGSRNGTLVNGTPLAGDCILKEGDVIQIGSTKVTYRAAV